MEMRIRPFRPADARAVWDLHNRALHQVGAHAGNGPWDQDLRDVPKAYQQAGGAFLVGVIDGKIVAMGGLRRRDRATAELTRMRVEPTLQRRGLGQAMLDALTARAGQLGFTRLVLETTTGQLAAQGLYEKNGFARAGQSRLGPFDVLHYAKDIASPHQANSSETIDHG